MHHLSSTGRRNVFSTLNITYFAIFAGYSIWRIILPNYTVETFNISAGEIGSLSSLFAIPGVFAVCIGFVARKVNPSILMAASCLLVGLGLIWIGLLPVWNLLWCGVLAIGIGFAAFYPIITSFCIESTAADQVSLSLGLLKGFGPLAALASALLIQFAITPFGYDGFLILTGIFVSATGLTGFTYVRKMKYVSDQGNLSLKLTLWPYYALNFLAGCRSAFFKFFIIFLLVKEHGLKIQQTAWIGMIGSLFIAFSYFVIGKIAGRYKYSNVLSLIYVLVAIVYIGFAAFKNIGWVLVLLFWCDSLLFGVSVLTDGYLKKTSVSSNLVGDVATGLTLFYLAGFLMPRLVGMIWDNRGSESAFAVGSILALLAALVSRKLVPVTEKR
jgi:MFS family permease